MVFFNLDYVAIGILALVLVGQVLFRKRAWFLKNADDLSLSRRFSKTLNWFWVISVFLILAIQTYWSAMLYQAWEVNPLSRFFLPPYQPISYFLSYVGFRFFAPWILSAIVAFLVSRLAKFLNKKFDERFFEQEEIELIALGTFLTGYPGFFFYLSLLLFGYLMLQIVNNLRIVFSRTDADLTRTSADKTRTNSENHPSTLLGAGADERGKVFLESASSERLSAYYLWIPFAIFAIIIKIKFLYLFGIAGFWGQFSLGDFYKLFFSN